MSNSIWSETYSLVDIMPKSLSEPMNSNAFDKKAMIKQLHQFCEINSGTNNLEGLSLMRQTLFDAFCPLADDIQTHSFPPISYMNMSGDLVLQPSGDALLIKKRPHLKRRVLLSGHMDTVYGIEHPFQTLNYINNNCLSGPGVADMKGGIVVLLHALRAFENTPHATQIGWDVLINADEETGSIASSALLSQIAPMYGAALVFEPAMTSNGLFAKNRKGSGKLTLIASGKSAHAGRSFYEGRNAICFLSEIVTQIHALNGLREGVTINVGFISGGVALNVVPDKAVAKLDIRISQKEDEHWVRQQLDTITQSMKQEGYSLHIHGSFDRPVKRVSEKTNALFNRIKAIGKEMGLTLDWQDSGGCCDGNNLAEAGLAVIDTLGVRGGDIHSPNEFILLDSLVERALLSTLLLQDLAQGGLEGL